MKSNDIQLGQPSVLYKGTKAAIEALASVPEGATAYATDTDKFGFYTGAAWVWGDAASIATTVTGFNGILGSADDTVQKALSTIDDHVHSLDQTLVCQGRLTLETGVPISTTDQSAKTTLYFTPFRGTKIALSNGSSWRNYNLTEISISLAGKTASKPYDVFVYADGVNPTLELLAWTNATTRATALEATSWGVYVKNGDATRRYVGTIYINSSGGQTDDTLVLRNVWNYYNRVPRRMYQANSTSNTYNGVARLWNNSEADNRIEFTIGVAEDANMFNFRSGLKPAADGNYANALYYIDGAAAGNGVGNYNAQYVLMGGAFPYLVAAGMHYCNIYQSSDATATFANFLMGAMIQG